jgi:hypothetical protein
MPYYDDFQDPLATLETELEELHETLEMAYAAQNAALQSQVLRRVDQIGEILANFPTFERTI